MDRRGPQNRLPSTGHLSLAHLLNQGVGQSLLDVPEEEVLLVAKFELALESNAGVHCFGLRPPAGSPLLSNSARVGVLDTFQPKPKSAWALTEWSSQGPSFGVLPRPSGPIPDPALAN